MKIVPQAHPSTLDWLQARFSLSSLFMDSIVNVSYGAKSGDLCFLHHGKDGKIDRIGKLQAREYQLDVLT